MPVTSIPDDHHIVKYLKNREYYLHNGRITPYPEAFHLRGPTNLFPQEETISGVYYEWFDGTAHQKLQASVHFIDMSMKRKDALIRMNAGRIRKQGTEVGRKLRVTNEPEEDCPPYSAIRGLPVEPDQKLCALLASMTLVEAVDLGTVL